MPRASVRSLTMQSSLHVLDLFVQDYSVLYDNADLPVICEGWHFVNTWKTLARPHHFTKRGGVRPIKLV